MERKLCNLASPSQSWREQCNMVRDGGKGPVGRAIMTWEESGVGQRTLEGTHEETECRSTMQSTSDPALVENNWETEEPGQSFVISLMGY